MPTISVAAPPGAPSVLFAPSRRWTAYAWRG